MNLLVVDDDASIRRTLRITLESMGHHVVDAADRATALRLMAQQPVNLALVDLRLGRESGLDAIAELLRANPQLGVVLITAYATVATAVEAIRAGAFDYLPKPFTPDQLRVVLERWESHAGLRRQVLDLQEEVQGTFPEVELATEERSMQQIIDIALQVADTNASVLLRGESGTGKGVLARYIHSRSRRAGRPFVTVHCPSLSGELLESELFGHARGAFTGAVQATEGKVAAAEGGTLFLDEIGDLPLTLQPKLLRFLQDRNYERVGETRTRSGDVRLIAATNRDLEGEVRTGQFREDLLYRLNVIELLLPALRDRPRDILRLAQHHLCFFARQAGKALVGFTPESETVIQRYPWPGNIRELRNAIERGVILTRGPLVGLEQLPNSIQKPSSRDVEVGGPWTLEQLEAEHIRRVLGRVESLEEAAAILGIDVSTLYRKRRRFGL